MIYNVIAIELNIIYKHISKKPKGVYERTKVYLQKKQFLPPNPRALIFFLDPEHLHITIKQRKP